MGTRSHIAFYRNPDDTDLENWDALIYRHWDGYPEGMLPDIVPVLKDFDEHRGLGDTEYASAWLVKHLKDDYLNVGISKDFHGDIEYLYAVYPDRVDVYATDFDFEGKKGIKACAKKIKTVRLRNYYQKDLEKLRAVQERLGGPSQDESQEMEEEECRRSSGNA